MLFSPTINVKSVRDIDARLLNKLRVRGLILDLDNTLSLHGSPAAEEGIFEWLYDMRRLGIKMVVLSNNTEKRVAPLAQKLGLEYAANGCKPLTFGISRAIEKLGLPENRVAIVGDQLFTDILGGNIKGIKSILVEPFLLETGWLFVVKRGLESLVFKRNYEDNKR